MKKVIVFLLLFSIIAGQAYAINIFEKAIYKKDVINMIGAIILANRLTGQIKYIWYRDFSRAGGHWEPLVGLTLQQYQAMYDQQYNRK